MSEFEPKIVAFLCNWCTYVAADAAGVSRFVQEPNVRVIRVNCSGMVDPSYVVKAFASGADGVLVGGCWPGDCHYQSGNIKAMRRAPLLRKLLGELGVEELRFRLKWIAASEPSQFARTVNEMTEEIRTLGPFKRRRKGARRSAA
jgi:F420-non-reducing hydrogenase iron-sulfur subunit